MYNCNTSDQKSILLHGKLNKILKDMQTNYKILIFDTNKPPLITNSDSLHVEYHDIEKKIVGSI